jgi:hypothetical protein
MSDVSSETFDGFSFTPTDNEEDLELAFFKVKREMGNPIDSTSVGDMFHVAFFRMSKNKPPEFDEEFEAVFADPKVYVQNLIGAKICGTFLRKTENSGNFWKEYLNDLKTQCKMTQIQVLMQAISKPKN